MEFDRYRRRDSANSRPSRKRRRGQERRRVLRAVWRTTWIAFLGLSSFVVLTFVALVAIGTLTPWGNATRMMLAETVASTRHYRLARYMTSAPEYAQIVKAIDGTKVVNTGITNVVRVAGGNFTEGPVRIQKISGKGYNGFVVLIHDPRLVRLVEAKITGDEGEYITSMAPRVGAVVGINASGFEDPNGEGWGGIPVGLEMVGYRVINPMRTDNNWTTVGFTAQGVMVMGRYSTQELYSLKVRDAMQFRPELVVNGQPMITVGDGGWGIDPRTAIGQTGDGTVLFVVINGRFRAGSIGATQKQVMDVMLQYHAVNACAMDGGSSSVLYAMHKILNSPSTIDPNGERHLPDAWMVFPDPTSAAKYAP